MGLLDALLGQQSPISQFVDRNSNAIGALGAGLAQGPDLGSGFANAAALVPQARQLDRQQAQQTQTRNATMVLLQQKAPDLASAVESGALTPGAAVQAMFQRQAAANKPQVLSPGDTLFQGGKAVFTAPNKPAADPALVQEYNFAKGQGYQGSFTDFMAANHPGTTINLKNMGTIPPGFRVQYDASGNPVQMVPIPGSPAATEAQAASDKANNAAGAKSTATDTILNAATQANRIASSAPSFGPLGTTVAGPAGQGLSSLPFTQASELRRQVKVLTSNVSIEALNAMRQSSPTGGALGNVTEKEEQILASTAGAIDPNASPEDFQRQLGNYVHTLLRIVNGPEAGDKLFAQWQSQQGGGGGQTVYTYNPATGQLE